jgi:hypothetical protein
MEVVKNGYMRVSNGNGWAVICSKAYINWINLQITALMAAMKHAVLQLPIASPFISHAASDINL